jgi:hypothetical protein
MTYDSMRWNTYIIGPYKTNHNIYVNYTGPGELV